MGRKEANERKILSTENQLNRIEDIYVKGENPLKRSWFQSKVDRQISRIEKSLDQHSSAGGGKKKHKPNLARASNADSRMKQELMKSEKFRLKIASRNEVRQDRFKKTGKQKKVGRCVDPEPPRKKSTQAKTRSQVAFLTKKCLTAGRKEKTLGLK